MLLQHMAVTFLIDPTDGAQLVTVPDAARLMNCSTRTISNWIQRGLVDVRRTPTGSARVVVSSLWKRSAARSSDIDAGDNHSNQLEQPA